MSIRRKVFVINTTADTGGNLIISTNLVNSPAPYGINNIIESGKLLFGYNKAGATIVAIDSAAEVRQAVSMTTGTLVAGQKYTLIRESNPMGMLGRDANYYGNIKKYTWQAPAVIADQATSRTALINAIIAKVNADTSNFATASTTDGSTANLTITEAAGYGLLPSYPGPANWMMTGAGTEIIHAYTAGKQSVGYGNFMLANRCLWTLDGTRIKSGSDIFNFDNGLPVSTKTYCTFIITEYYGMKDHNREIPTLSDEILLYVDETTADHIANLKTAFGI